MSAEMSGMSLQYLAVKSKSSVLVGSRATHLERIWLRSSTEEEHDGESRQRPVQFNFQLLHNDSVLYLPESIRAWTVAIVTFAGEDPADDQIRYVVVRDMYKGLK